MEDTSAGQNGDLLSSVEAGKRFGCTNDYVARLARQGKVYGIRVGREWFVDPTSLGQFIMQVEAAKHERATRLQEQRKLEFVTATAAQTDTAPEDFAAMRPRRAVLIETGALMVLGVLLGAFLFVTTHSSDGTPEAALAHGASLIERCADDLYGGNARNTPCISRLSTIPLGAALGNVLEDITSDLGFVVRELLCDAASWFSDTACGGTPLVATIEPVVAEEPTPTIVAVSPSNASAPRSSRTPPIVAAAGTAMVAEPAYVTQSVTKSTTIIREYHEVPGKNGDSSGFSVDLFRGQVDQIYDDIQESADSNADDIDEALSDIAESFETDLLAVMGNAQIDGNFTVAGGATFLSELAAYGPLIIPSVNATSTSATSTFAGALHASRTPAGAHTFGAWSPGVAGANPFGASLLVNPSSADADSNLISAAVNGSTKFLVDAEGDTFANSLTTTGSVTLASTTASSFVVEGDTTLGDASADLVTVNAALLANASITLNADLSMSGLATLANASTTVLSVSGSTHFPGGIWNASGNVGIGTTSPAAKLSVAGNAFIGGDLVAIGTVTFSGVTNGLLYANGLGAVSASSTLGASMLDASVIFSQEIDTSAELAAIIGDETGDGAVVFAGSPALTGVATLANASTTVLSVSGSSYLGTVAGGTWNASDIDVSDYTNFTVTATGLTLNDDTLELTSGYTVPRSASTTSWNSFYDSPSSRITAGDALTWSGNTLNFDGGDAPGGQLGGTWASPTIDDLFVLNTGDSISGTLTFSGSSANIALAANWLSGDGDDEGVFVNSAGNVGIGTTTPAKSLDIYSGDADALNLTRGTNNNIGIGFKALGSTNTFYAGMNTSGNFALKAGDANFGSSPLFVFTPTGNLGIGTTSPWKTLSVSGDLSVTGGYYDSSGDVGSANQVLTSTGSGTNWVSTSTLGFLTAASLDTSAKLAAILTDETGTGSVVFSASPTLSGIATLANASTSVLSVSGNAYFPSGIWNSSGNVGIGTTTPSARLSAVGAISTYGGSQALGGPSLQMYYDTSGDTGRIDAVNSQVTWKPLVLGASTFRLLSGGVTQGLYQDSSGNVGIGTTTPDTDLVIYNAGTSDVFTRFRNDSQTAGFDVGLSSAGGAYIYNRNNSTLNFGTNNSTNVTISTAGNVGIGKAPTTAKLEIANTVDGTPGTAGSVRIYDNLSGIINGLGTSAGSFDFRSVANFTFFSGATPTEYMRLTSSGNLGIGTTTPGQKLDVWGNIRADNSSNASIIARSTGGNAELQFYDTTNGGGTLFSQNGVTYLGTLNTSGSWTANRIAVSNSSGNVGIGVASPQSLLHTRGSNGVPSTSGNMNTGVILSSGSGAPALNLGGYNSGVQATSYGFISSAYENNAGVYLPLALQPNGGNVGVGTTSPSSRLSTYLEGYGGVAQFSSLFVNNAYSIISSSTMSALVFDSSEVTQGSAKPLYFSTGGTIRTTIGSSGNVGIGTTSPSARLDVIAADQNTLGFLIGNSTYSGVYLNGLGMQVTDAGTALIRGGWNTAQNIVLNDNGGNVGIGIASPASKFQIMDTLSGLSTGIKFNPYHTVGVVAGTQLQAIDADGSTARVISLNPSGGNVGIGTTTPSTKLDIRGTAVAPATSGTAPSSIISISGASNNVLYAGTYPGSPFGAWLQAADRSNLATEYPLILNPNGGSVGIGTSTPTAQLSTTGTVRFSNFGAGTLQTDASGNLSVSSDERLKNVEGDFARGLDAIIALEPINFTWKKSSGFDTASTYAGFSAQNVQLAIPEAVGEDPHGLLTLSDRPILAAVVNAIKELNLRVVGIADAIAGFAHELVTERIVTTQLCATRSNGSIECVTGDELADLLESGTGSTSSGDSSNDAPADEDEPAADAGTDLEPDEDAGMPPTNTGGDHPEDLSVGIDDPEASSEEPALQNSESVESPTAPSEDGTPAETAIAPVDPANTPPADGGADPVAAPQAE